MPRVMVLRALLVAAAVFLAQAGGMPAASAGSICRDGSWTASEGRGTCSHHGGVRESGVNDPGGRKVIGGSGSSGGGSTGSGNASASSGGYSRSKFKHWITQPDGCSTREEVLIDEAISGERVGCAVVHGEWYSTYDDVTTTDPSAFDIDHVVPLKEAWLSGADQWSAARRQAFANDLGWAYSLIAVSAASNRSKSDRDPARWLPPRAADRCRYVQTWVGVKYRWKLSMDAAEKRTVNDVLENCKTDTDLTRPPRAG